MVVVCGTPTGDSNKDKTKVMLFNTAKQSDFMPEIAVDGENLEVVEEFKLLGVMISSKMGSKH